MGRRKFSSNVQNVNSFLKNNSDIFFDFFFFLLLYSLPLQAPSFCPTSQYVSLHLTTPTGIGWHSDQWVPCNPILERRQISLDCYVRSLRSPGVWRATENCVFAIEIHFFQNHSRILHTNICLRLCSLTHTRNCG